MGVMLADKRAVREAQVCELVISESRADLARKLSRAVCVKSRLRAITSIRLRAPIMARAALTALSSES